MEGDPVNRISRREFVATAAVVGAGAAVRSSAFALESDGQAAARSTGVDRAVVASHARPFPMNDVRLQPGAFSAAAEVNRGYLKTLAPDRLLHTFRLTAGLPSSAEPLGDWEKPDC